MIAIRSSGIVFAEGTAVRLPQPLNQALPIASIAGQGSYDIGADAVALSTLDLDLGGPKLSAEGRVAPISGADIAGEATLFVSRVKVDELATYWPTFVAPGGRALGPRPSLGRYRPAGRDRPRLRPDGERYRRHPAEGEPRRLRA